MKTKTIQAYGYEVTGTEDIIADIEESLNDPNRDPNREICWNKFNSKDIIFAGNGDRVYSVKVDHENKKVLAYEYEFAEWWSLKVGDRVKRASNKLEGNIIATIDDFPSGYIVQWDNGEKEKITDRTLSKIKN